MYGVAMALFTPILISNIKQGEPAFKKKMWIMQAVPHVSLMIFTLVNAFKK